MFKDLSAALGALWLRLDFLSLWHHFRAIQDDREVFLTIQSSSQYNAPEVDRLTDAGLLPQRKAILKSRTALGFGNNFHLYSEKREIKRRLFDCNKKNVRKERGKANLV
jgi:hypothetical protein